MDIIAIGARTLFIGRSYAVGLVVGKSCGFSGWASGMAAGKVFAVRRPDLLSVSLLR
jgi:hypothetical protein